MDVGNPEGFPELLRVPSAQLATILTRKGMLLWFSNKHLSSCCRSANLLPWPSLSPDCAFGSRKCSVQVSGCTNQCEMSKCLREIPEMPAVGAQFF